MVVGELQHHNNKATGTGGLQHNGDGQTQCVADARLAWPTKSLRYATSHDSRRIFRGGRTIAVWQKTA